VLALLGSIDCRRGGSDPPRTWTEQVHVLMMAAERKVAPSLASMIDSCWRDGQRRESEDEAVRLLRAERQGRLSAGLVERAPAAAEGKNVMFLAT